MTEPQSRPNWFRRLNGFLKEYEPFWTLPLQIVQTIGGVGVIVGFVSGTIFFAWYLVELSVSFIVGAGPFILAALPACILWVIAKGFDYLFDRNPKGLRFMRRVEAYQLRRRRHKPRRPAWASAYRLALPQLMLSVNGLVVCGVVILAALSVSANERIDNRIQIVNARINEVVRASKDGTLGKVDELESLIEGSSTPVLPYIREMIFACSMGFAASSWTLLTLDSIRNYVGFSIWLNRRRERLLSQRQFVLRPTQSRIR